MPAHKIPIEIRFWQKVVKSDGCWLWTGAINGRGYGHIRFDGDVHLAHRVAYHLTFGQIPEGLDLDHLCRVRHCVNPAHIEAVPRSVNIARGEGATARHKRQTHCKRGHEFTPENTYVWRTSRICRTCQAARRKRVA